MNTRRKGRRNEYRCKEALEADGWKVLLTPPPARFKKEQDLFGLFDMIAVKGNKIRFIQVKTNRDGTGVQWKHEAKQYSLIKASCAEIWIYTDREKEPRIKEL